MVKYEVPAQEVFAAQAKFHEDVGTAELGAAVWAFNHDGEPVARSVINVKLAVDERKARTRTRSSSLPRWSTCRKGRTIFIWPYGTQ